MPDAPEQVSAVESERGTTGTSGGDASQRARGLELSALLVGALLGLWGVSALSADTQVDFEELALGEAEDAGRAVQDGFPVHCDGFATPEDRSMGRVVREFGACAEGALQRGAGRVALWLGNSQVHAINQYEPGDESAPGPVHRALGPDGIDFLTMSYPNANQQEHLVSYAYFKARLPLRTVVLNLVFDDFREAGIRARLHPALKPAGARAVLQQSEIGLRLLQAVEAEQVADNGTEQGAATLQSRSEDLLTTWLVDHVPLWAARPRARGTLFNGAYQLRNTLFGITPQSVRKVIPARYADNRAAVEAILRDASRDGIEVIGYIAPLRNDVAPPYVVADYERFKTDMAELFAAHDQRFENLEDLVPAEHWGSMDAITLDGGQTIDFMHFRAEGHVLVADALTRLVRESQQ